MLLSLGTFVEALDKRKNILITSIDFLDDENVMVYFEISGSGKIKSEKITGNMPISKDKLPLLLNKDETPTTRKISSKQKKEPVEDEVIYKSEVITRESSLPPEPVQKKRRVRCPATGNLITSEEYHKNRKEGKYKNL